MGDGSIRCWGSRDGWRGKSNGLNKVLMVPQHMLVLAMPDTLDLLELQLPAPQLLLDKPTTAMPAPPAPYAAIPPAPVPAGPAPADTVVQQRIAAPVRTHTRITPQVTNIVPQINVQNYNVDVPVAVPRAV